VVTAAVDIGQWYCVVCGVYCGYSKSRYSVMVLCCVGGFYGYSSSSIRAMVMYFMWSLLWLQQQ